MHQFVLIVMISYFDIQGNKDENPAMKKQKPEDELHPHKVSDQDLLGTKSTLKQDIDGWINVEPENLNETQENLEESRGERFGHDFVDQDAMEPEQQYVEESDLTVDSSLDQELGEAQIMEPDKASKRSQNTDEPQPEETHQEVPPSEVDCVQTQAAVESQQKAQADEQLEQESDENNKMDSEVPIVNQDKNKESIDETGEEPKGEENGAPVNAELNQYKEEELQITPRDVQETNEPALQKENQEKEEEPETMLKEDFQEQEETEPVLLEVNHDKEQIRKPASKEEPNEQEQTKPVRTEEEEEEDEQESISSDAPRGKDETDPTLSGVNNEQEQEPEPRSKEEIKEQMITEPVEVKVSQDKKLVQETTTEDDPVNLELIEPALSEITPQKEAKSEHQEESNDQEFMKPALSKVNLETQEGKEPTSEDKSMAREEPLEPMPTNESDQMEQDGAEP